MTTIRLVKAEAGVYLELFSATVEEVLNKNLTAEWAEYASNPDTPTTARPLRYVLDLLDITRTFVITAKLTRESIQNSSFSLSDWSSYSVYDARDNLNLLMRYGGSCRFIYGISSEVSTYSPTDVNGYFYGDGTGSSDGFECYVTRIQYTERGNDDLDEHNRVFDVIIQLVKATGG